MEVIRNAPQKATIVLSDSFDALSAPELKEKVLALYQEGCYNLSFDFTNITSLSSSGLGRLIIFQKTAKENNGEINIINIKNTHVRKMLDAINLRSVIDYS